MKASVLTLSARIGGLKLLAHCLKKQTSKDFEWVIVGPEFMEKEAIKKLGNFPGRYVPDPPKKLGTRWSFSAAMNEGVRNL